MNCGILRALIWESKRGSDDQDAGWLALPAGVGVGTVGASWAAFFASQGLPVSVYDRTPAALEKGLADARAALARLEAAGLLAEDADHAATRLRAADSLEAAVAEADFVQETVYEDYGLKAEVWRSIERHAPPEAVIASSTSGLLISQLAEALKRPERALVAHPFNPPHLINLVELVPGPCTDTGVLESVKQFYKMLGKAPVVLLKEVGGHIANRLQAAVWREAISLVHRGVATVEDVDTALHEGPGVRWALLGQHAIFDLGGGEAAYRGLFEGIGKSCFEQLVWPSMDTWSAVPDEGKEACIAGIEQWYRQAG
ncbi:lcdH [Symbiodinium natans]|uniref:LcdH protein n=1 Tax=Symbiodinium natans TaxID=878477 RepID=A0A812KNU7_9DINO|nr:lcdH [Symbiodinium natans]